MTELLPLVDVVIIGMGASGSVAAHVLTKNGHDVVGLEAGPRVDASMMSLDEVRNDIQGWLSVSKASHEAPTWRTSAAETAATSRFPTRMANAVGGSAVHYEGASLRFHPWHFASRTESIRRYGEASLPAGSTVVDWPLTYDDLEPYYDLVEYAIGVSGRAGNLARDPGRAGGNYFEGPRQREYPMPPLPGSGWTSLMAEAARQLNWHPFPVPAAINSQEYQGRAACSFCGFCQHNGCYRNAKGAPDVTLIPMAEKTGLLRIETEARATRIKVDQDGLASGVEYVKNGRRVFQSARAVLLSGYVFENTRLLLLSTSTAYPDGLANNHAQVGRHFMAHVTPFCFGNFPGRRLNRWNGSGGQIVCVDDWNSDMFDHEGAGFIGGALLMSMGEVRPIMAATNPLPPSVPGWGSAWKAWFKENAQSIGSAFAQFENLPHEENMLDLDPNGHDRFGVPLVRVTHAVSDNDRAGAAFMIEKLKCWLQEAGAETTWSSSGVALDGRHACGGTRMGNDAESSVVDAYGMAHEVPNLAVLGASVFPTSGGHNPTLTLQALAWRTAEHLTATWNVRSRDPRREVGVGR